MMAKREGNYKIIEGKEIIKDFVVGKKNIRVLRGLDFDIFEGEFVMINGPSGCGKSTLMNIMNGWDGPTSGSILVDGDNLYNKSESKRAKALRGRIGMVHQAAFWVKSLSVIDNVAIPYMLRL
jgi:putative ABC transport system ATP-binding protein